MKFTHFLTKLVCIALLSGICVKVTAQSGEVNWTKDGTGYYKIVGGAIVEFKLPKNEPKGLVPEQLTLPAGASGNLQIKSFTLSDDASKVLIFTNSKKVWRE